MEADQWGSEMKIDIIAVGSIKESYLREAISEYSKRLSAYCELTIHEVAEEKLPKRSSAADIAQAIEREGDRILARLPKSTQIISLCVEGRQQDSVQFADALSDWAVAGGASLSFVIGGSDGLSERIKRMGARVSFSRMTFPHQLMRVILLEQIYRGFRIQNHEPYHK